MLQTCTGRTKVLLQYLMSSVVRLEDDETGVFGCHGDVVVVGFYGDVVVGWHGDVVITCACVGDLDGAVDRASGGACGDS